MRKIVVVIADQDPLYLRQLSGYLLNNAPDFDVDSYSKVDKLQNFLRRGESVDILLLGENMRCRETDQCTVSTKILLCENDGAEQEGYDSVKKYQKTSDLLSEVLLLYRNRSGHVSRLSTDGRGTKLLAVYSPVGGSGKTTLALSLAHLMGRQGKTLYLNFERVNSTRSLLPENANINLSDLLVMIRTGDPEVGLTLHNKMCSDPDFGFSYVNPADSALELNEITVDEQIQLLNEAASLGEFSTVVLDLDSELNADKLRILQLCSSIVLPFMPEALGINKLKQFYRELKLHAELQGLARRIIGIGNKIGAGAENYLRQCGIFELLEPAAMLPWDESLANLLPVIQRGNLGEAPFTGLLNRLYQAGEGDANGSR